MSGYFRSLFSSGLVEVQEGKVTLHNLSTEVFDEVFKYMYEGDYEPNKQNVLDVLFAADMLDIGGLLSQSKVFLSQNLSASNCVTVFFLAQNDKACPLYMDSRKFILKHFDSLSKRRDFFKLSYEDIKGLVSDSSLVTSSEDLVVNSILRWFRFHKELGEHSKETNADEGGGKLNISLSTCRQEIDSPGESVTGSKSEAKESDLASKRSLECPSSLADLLKATRYLLISGHCLSQTLACDPLFQSDRGCQAIQGEIVRYKTQIDCHQDACPLAATHRLSDRLCDNIIAFTMSSLYLRSSQKWERVSQSDDWYSLMGLAYYNGKLYRRLVDGATQAFSFESKQWIEIAASQNRDEHHRGYMRPIGNELVALCTKDDESYHIECLSLQKHKAKWTRVGKLFTTKFTLFVMTNIGSILVTFLRCPERRHFTIECFHSTHGYSFSLSNQLEADIDLTAFKHDEETFVLQSNGNLWKLSAIQRVPYIKLTFEISLWRNIAHKKIISAIIDKDDLLVFGPEFDQIVKAREENTAYLEVFKRVVFQYAPQNYYGVIHIVSPANFFKANNIKFHH